MTPIKQRYTRLGFRPWYALAPSEQLAVMNDPDCSTLDRLDRESYWWKDTKFGWTCVGTSPQIESVDGCVICQNEGQHDIDERPHVMEGQE